MSHVFSAPLVLVPWRLGGSVLSRELRTTPRSGRWGRVVIPLVRWYSVVYGSPLGSEDVSGRCSVVGRRKGLSVASYELTLGSRVRLSGFYRSKVDFE